MGDTIKLVKIVYNDYYKAMVINGNKKIAEVENSFFEKKVYEQIDNIDRVTIEIIYYPSKEHGNCYWVGIEAKKVCEDLFIVKFYRGSDTYCAWTDIGLSGVKVDFERYYKAQIIRELVKEFIDNPKTFDIDYLFDDIGEADHIAYGIFDIDEILETTKPCDENRVIVRIWDYEGDEKTVVFKDKELTQELKEKLKNYFNESFFSEETITTIKKIIDESKTIRQFFEKYQSIH